LANNSVIPALTGNLKKQNSVIPALIGNLKKQDSVIPDLIGNLKTNYVKEKRNKTQGQNHRDDPGIHHGGNAGVISLL